MKAETIIGPGSVVDKPERHYIGIRIATAFDGMFAVITKELKTLRKWAKAHGVGEEGPYFVRYYHCDMKQVMEVEVCLMTPKTLTGEGNIRPGTLPAGRFATLNYRGNGLRGNQALMKWARDQGLKFDAIDASLSESYVCRYEAYLTDYRQESRKLLWDIEMSIKLAT